MIVSKETIGEAASYFTVRKVPKLRTTVPLFSDIFTQTKANMFAAVDLNVETGDARIIGSNDQVHNMRDKEFALVVMPEHIGALVKILRAGQGLEKVDKEIAQQASLIVEGNKKPAWYKRILGMT